MAYIEFDKIDGLYTDLQRRVASVIKDIFPTVRLIRLDSLHPAFTPEQPYALIDEPHLMPAYVIRSLPESEIDHRLVAWLVDNNNADPNSKVHRLDILEMANKAVEAKREVEWMEERKDVMKSIMKSKQNTYTHDGHTLRK
tara:strand:+ start:333 stop:755 length:423 start_codon:yes stop_codon:yes gene_type:complete